MPIRNVRSTLPDEEYVKALEAELRALRTIAERALEIAMAALKRR